MNSHFIDFIIGNLFSEVIPVADTFFNMDGVRVTPRGNEDPPSDTHLSCDYPLELSWVLYMTLNIYHEHITTRNRPGLLRLIARKAAYYIAQDYPEQAVLFSVPNTAEYWFKQNFPHQAGMLVERNGCSEYLCN
ncbi:MAG: hypothetical protein WC372_00495 [Candidatus Neomarinimicrobiota bacterium]|jgi:hypothetical protein